MDGTGEPSTPAIATLSFSAVGTGILQLEVAPEHSCALLASGAVRCWGAGSNGRLGYGNLADVETLLDAADVDLGGIAKQIAVGAAESCAVLQAGNVRCWGAGAEGRLGYGNTRDIGDDETPAAAGDVPVGGPVRSLVMQGAFACALLESGSVRCWGPGVSQWSDVVVGPDDDVARGCTTLSSGVVECRALIAGVGYGLTGVIGDDETPQSMGDIPLAGPAKRLVVGDVHACVLLVSGGVQCWGAGGGGRLGLASEEDIGDDETPAEAGFVDVAGSPTLASQPTLATQIVSGGSHSCALLDSGTLRCWGEAAYGQLGYGSKRDVGDDEAPKAAGDVDVRGEVRQVSARGRHTCAVLDGGAVRCWGPAENGVLGYGDSRDIGYSDVPAAAGYVDVGGPVRQIQTSDYESCAVLESGALRCWGGSYGVTGEESGQLRAEIEVGGRVREVALGRDTCVLLEGGAVRCWGRRDAGIIGHGMAGVVATPAEVPALSLPGPAQQLVLGYDVACVSLVDGKVHCWGQASTLAAEPSLDQSIGDGSPRAQLTLELSARAAQIAMNVNDRGCAVLEDGRVQCWGVTFYSGYEDSESYSYSSLEDPIDLGAPALSVSMGDNQTCALLETGRVCCWGYSEGGGLGQPKLFGRAYVEAWELDSVIDLF